MLNNNKIIIYILLIISFGKLNSQGGSNYSIFGIGEVNYNNSAYFAGLGSTSIAVRSDKQINVLNPALLGAIKTTRLQVGYLFNQNYVETEKSSLFQNNGKVNGFNAVFALDTSMDISITLGLNPYSNVNFYISNPVNIFIDSNNSYSGRANYQGIGGLSSGQIGISGKIINDLYLGFLATYKFGTIQYINTVTMYDVNSYYSLSRRNNIISGAGIKAGAYYEPISGLGIGVFYDKTFTMNNETQYKYGSKLLNDTVFSLSSDLELPPTMGFGLSYKTGKFIFAADYINQDFTKFNLYPNSKFTYKPLTQYSLGISRLGNRAFSSTYLDKITYNFGFGMKDQYYKIGNEEIKDMFLSLGFEIPVAENSLINTSFIFGKRGTLNNGLVQEYYGKFMVDFSIGETWFKPFIREY